MLSAFVPRELFEKPGSQRVYLLNSFGESNQLEFVVEPQQHSAAAD
jgi:hypothetical protein